MLDRKRVVVAFIAFALCFVGLWLVLNHGIRKHEIAECRQWQEIAKKTPDFFLMRWQKDQCDHYKIEIWAPVKGETNV